jgi:hypothetical protein
MTLFATSAFAQGKARPGNDDNGKAAKAAAEVQRERKENEAAAKDALSKIPDSKEKYDPWKIAR